MKIADAIPYNPWFVMLPGYTGMYLSVICMLAIVLAFARWRNRQQDIAPASMEVLLLGAAIILVGLFLFALIYPVVFASQVVKSAEIWRSFNKHIGLISLFMNLVAGVVSIVLLVRSVRKPKGVNSAGWGKSFRLPIIFVLALFVLPLIEGCLIGPRYPLYRYLFNSSFLIALVMVVAACTSWLSPVRSYLRWLSMAILLTIITEPASQAIITSLQVQGAIRYSRALIARLESEKTAKKVYPESINVTEAAGYEPPSIVRRSFQYYHHNEDDTFVLQLWADPWIFYEYDSKEKKWSAFRSNLWY